MNNKGLHIVLEQNRRQDFLDWLERQKQKESVQQVLTKYEITTEESRNCTTCKGRIDATATWPLGNKDGNTGSDGLAFNEIYYKRNGVWNNLQDELDKLIKDDIFYDVDKTEEPFKSMDQDEQDRYEELTSLEVKRLKYICYMLRTLIRYMERENSNDPTRAANYWKKICLKFKVKYKKEEETTDDDGGDGDDTIVTKIFGCFDSTSESYWCNKTGNECPSELSDDDFDNVSNRTEIDGITYIHTGCTYEESITLENTYQFLGPGATLDADTYYITYKSKNMVVKIREKLKEMTIEGAFAPITNAPGFYNNEFYENSLRPDLDNALLIMLSSHCKDKKAIPQDLIVYEGNATSKPLGEFRIKQEDSINCIDDFDGLKAHESGEILQIRLKQLMFDELSEDGTGHRVVSSDIDRFNQFIDNTLERNGIEDDIIVDSDGKLQLEHLIGLGKILENKPIGLEKILK